MSDPLSKPPLLEKAPDHFHWPTLPEIEPFYEGLVSKFLDSHAAAKRLADAMMAMTSTRFFDWVDHIVVPKSEADVEGWKEKFQLQDDDVDAPDGEITLTRHDAQLPRIRVSGSARDLEVAIKVERIEEFRFVHRIGEPIAGGPFSNYRELQYEDNGAILRVIERRGYQGYVPEETSRMEAWQNAWTQWAHRGRVGVDQRDGMAATLDLAKELADRLGPDLAADAVFDAERHYWQAINQAGLYQKYRQDRLGLGWTNDDHHTFRSSRDRFPRLIQILGALGFRRREQFYAGEEAGWGAQVMEQPIAGLCVFADLDLTPEESEVDFVGEELPPLPKHNTVGLWCSLHGESMLDAGLHHLAALYEFDRLIADLEVAGYKTLAPFSDFPFLKQAFTKGEMQPVDMSRLEGLRRSGAISSETFEEFASEGAVFSHLENIQRAQGHRGFNQKNVSDIMRRINPERMKQFQD